MPTSANRKSPLRRRRAAEFFYLDDDHNRQDVDLHEPILGDGDHEAAHSISREVMVRLGLSPEEIDLVLVPAGRLEL